MAITLPDEEDLDLFSHDATAIFTEAQKEQAIQQAADLLYVATEVEEDSAETTVMRIVTWGILDMAWKLLITTENKSESYAPYSSERIGSYSYSKLGSYARAVESGVETGVVWFDRAVKLLVPDEEAAIFLTTEDVFTNGYTTETTSEWSTDYFGW